MQPWRSPGAAPAQPWRSPGAALAQPRRSPVALVESDLATALGCLGLGPRRHYPARGRCARLLLRRLCAVCGRGSVGLDPHPPRWAGVRAGLGWAFLVGSCALWPGALAVLWLGLASLGCLVCLSRPRLQADCQTINQARNLVALLFTIQIAGHNIPLGFGAFRTKLSFGRIRKWVRCCLSPGWLSPLGLVLAAVSVCTLWR